MLDLIFSNLRDRLQGDKIKANARLGLVSAPEGSSKLIWIHAGETRQSVMLAAAILAAIRHKRLDVRLVLTYENEFQDILVQHLSGLEKIGFGYGCANNKQAARRMVKRLKPFAAVFVNETLPAHILQVLRDNQVKHCIAFQTPALSVNPIEACYPSLRDVDCKSINASYVSKAFDAITQLVQAQVDKQLGALLQGDQARKIFLVHGADSESARKVLHNWRGSTLNGSSILSFTLDEPNGQGLAALSEAVQQAGFQPLLLSQWQKTAIDPQQVVIADEPRWFAALAVSSHACYIRQANDYAFWQMMASGSALIYDEQIAAHQKKLFPELCKATTLDALYEHCLSLQNNLVLQRQTGDACRKVFWQARREAEQAVEELLQRVFDW